jgi:hypothetical protein
MTIDSLPDAQFLAASNLLKSHIAAGHDVLQLRVTPSYGDRHVYVHCIAGLRPGTHAYDDATTAERFARSGFHVRIGARGAVKHLR